jgi:ubiquinone/menaquinone biosynthesis C-methylase UbiE
MSKMPADGKLDRDAIYAFWTEQVRLHGASPSASWSDVHIIEREIEEIGARLVDGERVLDVGCATGHSTVRFAARRRIRIRGLDYVPAMIEEARRRLAALEGELRGEVEFALGDVTALEEPDAAYDRVVSTRVIINLASWEQQVRGMKEVARVLKPGGTLLLSEATLQGWENMNAFRREWGLPGIPMPAFNRYLDEDKVRDALESEMELLEIHDFSSSYYVGTRVLKPLLAKALGEAAGVDVAKPDMHWNRFFSKLPPAGDYGVQRLFVLRKR